MCGICGVVGGDPTREEPLVKRMADALAHRGPDDEGSYADAGAVLGHRRLTIIDLKTGRQPLSNEDGNLLITYNGEIYNFQPLRDELLAKGHVFKTHTDTEVILHLFEEYGERCVTRLRGMFAFAIWDKKRRSLFAARDRFGQKPFFYAVRGRQFYFASEIKGLLAHPDISATPDPRSIDSYLSLRFVPPPYTMLVDVRKLPAAHHLTWENGQLRVGRYWEIDFDVADPGFSDDEWIAGLAERIEETVRVHMISDVPVGAFLSGGIDSSIVVAAMSRQANGPIPTFSIGSDVPSFDETPHAREVSSFCSTHHREHFVDADQLKDIPTLVRCLDEPSDPISACMFEVARLASRHVKVVLGGDGGDEIFAGFDRYAAYDWVGLYGALPKWFRTGLVRPALQRLPESFAYKSVSQRLRWLDALGSYAGGRRYARMTTFFRFGPAEREWCYGQWLKSQINGHDPELAIVEPFEQSTTDITLHRMLFADLRTRLPEHTLMLTDRLSMTHGLETRAPLLDHELAEYCAAMPANLKIRRGTTKYVMRKAAAGFLPSSIIRRPKQGFMFPVAYWLNEDTLGAIRRRLVGGPLVREGWIEGDGIGRLIEEHTRRRTDHHVRIWMLLNLDAWYRMYLQGQSAEEVSESLAFVSTEA